MPIIRGPRRPPTLTPERRAVLREAVAAEVEGRGTPDGPMVYEIPLDGTDKFDVLVVWDGWAGVPTPDRSDIIDHVYAESRDRLALTTGVTYQEASDQHLLPYAIQPAGSVWHHPEAIDAAMLAAGGFRHNSGAVLLEFPTEAMAKSAHEALKQKMSMMEWDVSTSHV